MSYTTKTSTRALLALALALGAASVTLAAPNAIGTNVSAPLDWDRNRAFADIMKTARDFTLPNSETAAPLDAQGWPTTDAQCVAWHGIDQMHGTYRLSFTGRATVELAWGTATLRNQVYDAATNTTTADLDYPSADDYALLIRFTGTLGGVRNVRLMRPIAPGSGTSYAPGTLFTDQFKAALAPFSTLRFMDFTAANWNQQATWSERVPPEAASFQRSGASYGWQGKGAAWEYVIALANETHKDAWICVPAHADDDYVLQLARLFHDGNPAAGFTPLGPDLKLYVEYSNEVWNWGFEQATYNDQQAAAELAAGDPYGYNYDGSNWAAAWRRVARKAADIGRLFRSVFGDEQMMARIRPVFCWQAVYKATGQDPLKYLEAAYIPRFAPGQPVSALIWGGGGSAYYSPENNSDSLTLDNIWASEAMDPFHWGKDGPDSENPGRQIYNAQVCHTFGIARLAYEGGPSLDNTGHSEAVKEASVQDPRMTGSVLAHHAAWSRWGGDLLMYYTLTHDYMWGFTSDVLDLDTPKMAAIQALAAAAEREPVAIGTPVPGSVDGNAFDVGYYAWDEPGSGVRRVDAGQWYSYLFNLPLDGIYELAVTVGAASDPTAGLVFLVDGVELPEQTLPGTSPATVTQLVELTQGLHSIRVRAEGGGFDLSSLAVRVSDVTDTEPPAAPTNLAAERVSPTRVELTWTPSTDDVGVSAYRVWRNGVEAGSVAGPAFTDTDVPANQTHTYFVVAVDVGGNVSEPSASVSVLPGAPVPPTITGQTAGAIGLATARLGATINPNGFETAARFEYGTTTAYGASSSEQALGAGTTPVTITADLVGLRCNMLYHYRATAANGAAAVGPDATFRTASAGCSTLQLGAATYRVSEGAAVASVIVRRVGSLAGRATVAYTTSDGSARSGDDYQARSGIVVFASGQAARTITVPIVHDTLDEADETFSLALADAQDAQLGTLADATVTIVDDDAGGVVQLTALVFRVNEAGRARVITVQRTLGAASNVTVDYVTSDGTAAAGADYSAMSGTLTFGAGQLTGRIVVPILNDLAVEGNETFTLQLGNPTGGARLGTRTTGTVTIVDNEGVVQWTAASYGVGEGRSARLVVLRSNAVDAGVTVEYVTHAGTAVAPDDYAETSGTLTFGAGIAALPITVPTVNDTVHEGPQAFTVELRNPQGARLGPRSTAAVTIGDND